VTKEVVVTTCLERLQQWLREQHIPYEVQLHRPVIASADMAAELHESAEHVAKVVIAQTAEQFVMLVVPASEQVDFKRVTRLLKVHAEAARERDFKTRFPDCEPGAMPPFGEFYGMPLYVDEALTHTTKLAFQAGTHRHALKLNTSDYMRLAQPKIVPLTRSRARATAG
jgi:Ala-tRNA(Pro) deacylase